MRLITRFVVMRQREFFTLLEHDRTVFELTEAHFRAFRVKHQRNDGAGFFCGFAYHADTCRMFFMVAVREIEPGTVHAVCNECVNDTRFFRSRTLRADNFRFFQHNVHLSFAQPDIAGHYQLNRMILSGCKTTISVLLYTESAVM